MRFPPLPTGVLAGLLSAAMLMPNMGSALQTLASARAERAALVAMAQTPLSASPPLVTPQHLWRAENASAARKAIADRVRTAARRGGVLVEALAAAPAPAGLAAVRLQLSGEEKAVLALADELERDGPLLRLPEWRVTALAGGGVRLTAEALAPWQ